MNLASPGRSAKRGQQSPPRKFPTGYKYAVALSWAFLLLTAVDCHGATWSVSMGGRGVDGGTGVLLRQDGGFVVLSTGTSFADDGYRPWLLKLGADGLVNWQGIYTDGSRELSYFPKRIQEIPGSGYLMGGYVDDPAMGWVLDFGFLRLGLDGTIVDQRQYTLRLWDLAYDMVVEDDGVTVAGSTEHPGEGHTDAILFRLDGAGAPEWGTTVREPGRDQFSTVRAAPGGGYVAAGTTGAAGGGTLLVKVNRSGESQWAKVYQQGSILGAESLQVTADGGYILVAGTATLGPGEADIWILKLDPLGQVEWQKTYGSLGIESARCVLQTENGGFLIGGHTDPSGSGFFDVFLLKLDADGALEWERVYGTPRSDFTTTVRETLDGEILVLGETDHPTNAGMVDVWLMRLTGDGLLDGSCLHLANELGTLLDASGTWIEPSLTFDSELPREVDVRGPVHLTPTHAPAKDLCSVLDCSAAPDEVSSVRNGAPPLRVLPGGRQLEVEWSPSVFTYHLYSNRLGSWFEADGQSGSECRLETWEDRGGETVILEIPWLWNQWMVVTAANACGEGPAGTDSSGTERTLSRSWELCGACP